MCLAVPMELVEIGEFSGVAEIGGVKREVNLMLVPDAKIGDFVIVHAGSAISLLSREEAKKTLDLLNQIENINDAEKM
ncbi:MAG: HypC/HybG/HupF family hydrogenase formation chaperone [Nitrospinota bacterium]|nr:HypC/HybG/HupF family hydrogenase formation chaperone [Nitrospinota bacterium]